MIVHAPQGAGKTRNAQRIANHFGLFEVIEGDDMANARVYPRFGALILTSNTEAAELAAEDGTFDVMTLGRALDLVDGTAFHGVDVATNRIEVPIAGPTFDLAAGVSAQFPGGFLSEHDNIIAGALPLLSPAPSFRALNPTPDASAPAILKAAADHLDSRAALRDQPQGERSMARTVAAFNALTGHQVSERDGWLFMAVLKAARACTTPAGILDDYQDGAAYFGLAGEAALKGAA
jgi:hypothetical protein